jgi:hypothetical protein
MASKLSILPCDVLHSIRLPIDFAILSFSDTRRRILLTHTLHLNSMPLMVILHTAWLFAIAVNIFNIKKPASYMSHKKEIKQPLDAEQAKELELDETPKPTRKVSNPSVPVSNDAEPTTHDRIKGRRVIK